MRTTVVVLLAALLLAAAPASDHAAFAALKFRSIGPLSGRIDTVSGVAGDPTTYYAGGLGGLFKSTDGGVSWRSIFNDRSVSSIGAVAVAPSDPATVYAGTGEANLRNDVAFGEGVWRSTDAGKTWTHVGLDATGSIAAIAVDPHDAKRAYVAALGDVYRASDARGIYRTTDGGATWKRVLAADDRTGASSIAIDPSNPQHLIAGMWTGWRSPYHLTSGGPDDGIYVSNDGGDRWTRLRGNGLPTSTMGRIAVAFAPSDPKRVYALIESSQGTLWRSDDGGTHWTLANSSHGIDQRPFYFTSLSVDPHDADRVYFMSVQLWKSADGGKTAKPMHETRGGDYHQLWIDPRDPNRMIAGDDGGSQMSVDGGRTWASAPIVTSQIYHLDVDDRVPYTICSEDQDSGSACGPSNSLLGNGILPDSFFPAGGGESGWILFDRADSNLIYGDGYQGSITQYDRRTGQAREIGVWPRDAMGWPAAPLRYRFQWTSPLAISPQHPHRLYMGGNRIFQTDDGGTTWHAISPDLTRHETAREGISGTPITPDNTSVEYYNVVFSIGPSPVRDGMIWAGTDDGRVWLTNDGGRAWHNVTPAAMRVAPHDRWLRVDYVAPSPFDARTAYVAADAHKWGDRRPYLFVTHDAGAHWSSISAGLPQTSYTRMIRPDPVRRGMLYTGTETGLFYSYDEGAHWTRFTNGLPVVPVYDFVVQPRFDDLVVATHGRGIRILDDLHPLQEWTPAIAAQPLHIFTLRDAYRFRIGYRESFAGITGANPSYGADVNFSLAHPPAKNEKVTVRILRGTQVIRTIAVAHPTAGVNRVWWNLRYDAIDPVKGFVPWARGGFNGPLALPGSYTVRVTAAKSSAQGTLRVLPDPRSHASPQALRAQLAMLLRIRGDLQAMTQAIERVQHVKAHDPAKAAQADRLLHELYNPEVTQAEDALRYPEALYGQISFLGSDVASADAAPTASEHAVLDELEREMHGLLAKVDAFASPSAR